jgi:hypothetical protein
MLMSHVNHQSTRNNIPVAPKVQTVGVRRDDSITVDADEEHISLCPGTSKGTITLRMSDISLCPLLTYTTLNIIF